MEQLPKCPRCGESVQIEWTFCRNCGYAPDLPSPEAGGGSGAASGLPDAPPPPPPPPPGLIDAPPPPPPPPPGLIDAPPPPVPPPTGEDAGFGVAPGFGAAPGFGGSSWPSDPAFSAEPEGPDDLDAGAPLDAPPPDRYDLGGGPTAAPLDSFMAEPLADRPPASGSDLVTQPDEPAEPDHSRTGGYDFSAPFDAGAFVKPPSEAPPAPSGGSPFAINKGVAIGAIAVAVVLVIGGIVLMTGGGSKSGTNGAAGTTLPPLGAVVNGANTTVSTTPPTTPTGGLRECDSPTSFHSPDGKDYRPCGSGFVVDFPGRPDIRTYDAQLSMGPIKWQVLTSTDLEDVPVRYTIAWSNLPREPTPEEAEEAERALVAQLGMTIGAPVNFQGHEGFTFKGVDNERDVIGVTFTIGDDVYALSVTSRAPTQKQLDQLGSWFHPT